MSARSHPTLTGIQEQPQCPPRVLVVGDLMLDRHLWGQCDRVSPESPVPVVRVERRTNSLGGAGNVLANLAGLGAEASIATALGTGPAGESVRSLLCEIGIGTELLLDDSSRPVTEKNRVLAGHQQVVRFDVETSAPIPRALESRLVEAVRGAIPDHDVVVLSDYAKGTITPAVASQVIAACRDHRVKVLIDPKGCDYSKYEGATLITPNQREAFEATAIDPTSPDAISRAGQELIARHCLGACLITRGEKGMALFEDGQIHELPTRAREVFDVTGAGDTVLAALAYSLARSSSLYDACHFANLAAGVVVGKVGTATTTLEEVLDFAAPSSTLSPTRARSLPPSKISSLAHELRSAAKHAAIAYGDFDTIDYRQIEVFERLACSADYLVVAVRRETEGRPLRKGGRSGIDSLRERMLTVASLQGVDCVTHFCGERPVELIQTLQPVSVGAEAAGKVASPAVPAGSAQLSSREKRLADLA